jgi:lysozyme family protein
MSRFDECLKFVLQREGGYVNHPNDRGGATNKGIVQRVYDLYRANKKQEPMSVQHITDEEVAEIYRNDYWRPIKADNLPAPIDLVVFDAAVNHGVRQASKFLQRSLGVGDDGVIGPKTIEAVHNDVAAGMTQKVAQDIIVQRSYFYDRLVQNDPSQSVFRKGWNNRLVELGHQVEAA